MLNLHFGVTDRTIIKSSDYFDVMFENHWLRNKLVVDAVRDIDRSTVIGDGVIESPVLGMIGPKSLSGGVKTVMLLLYKPENEYYGTACGNNCAKWFLEVANRHDIYLSYENLMRFPEPFEIRIANNGHIVHNMSELLNEKVDLM